MKNQRIGILAAVTIVILLVAIFALPGTDKKEKASAGSLEDTLHFDQEYELQATMVGYFDADGTRNPTLRAKKDDRVRITITNGETMTHDIALELLGIKSETLLEKGSSTSITFRATSDDTYFCTVPGHRAAGMVGRFEVMDGAIRYEVTEGLLPVKNGKTLNFGFETGTLADWTPHGDAFKNPETKDDPSAETPTGFEGNYYISSGGTTNYKLTGTLESVPFQITQPFASFKVSGGALEDTRVELVLKDSGKVIFQSTGQGRATLQPVVAELNPYLHQELFIRIVDNETGISSIPYIGDDIWGHINFDDFRFYPIRPRFPNELEKDDIIVLPPLDPVANSGFQVRMPLAL